MAKRSATAGQHPHHAVRRATRREHEATRKLTSHFWTGLPSGPSSVLQVRLSMRETEHASVPYAPSAEEDGDELTMRHANCGSLFRKSSMVARTNQTAPPRPSAPDCAAVLGPRSPLLSSGSGKRGKQSSPIEGEEGVPDAMALRRCASQGFRILATSSRAPDVVWPSIAPIFAVGWADEVGSWPVSCVMRVGTFSTYTPASIVPDHVGGGKGGPQRWDPKAFDALVREGNLEKLELGRVQLGGLVLSTRSSRFAAESGQLDALKYLRKHGCPWNAWTCGMAAQEGHLDVLKYAHENGCPWNEWTCLKAAEAGHLDVLQYAHENGCPWDEGTCFLAAAGDHLHVLKYARENGCPWNKQMCRSIANGHEDIITWIDSCSKRKRGKKK